MPLFSADVLKGDVCVFTYGKKFEEVAGSFCDLTGHSRQELTSMSFSDIFAKGHEEPFLKDIEAARATLSQISASVALRTKNGANINVRINIEFFSKEKILGFVFAGEDNSMEPCQIDGSCVLSSPLVIDLKSTNPHFPAILLVDPERLAIVEANVAALDFYGYSSQEMSGMPLSNISTLPHNILAQEVELYLLGKKSYTVSRHRLCDGTMRDVSVRANTVRFHGKLYIVEFVVDITRRKQLEKLLEEKTQMLAEMNVKLSQLVQSEIEERRRKEQIFSEHSRVIAMGEMLDAVAHYWRMPLNTIGVLVQDIEDAFAYGELNNEYLDEMVRKIMKHLNSVSRSVEDFRMFFTPSKERTLFNVKNIIDGVCDLISAKFVFYYIDVVLDCQCYHNCIPKIKSNVCSKGDLIVRGFLNEFRQVILNILTNSQEAIAVARKKGILKAEDEGKIFIKIKSEDDLVKIIFEDNGIGIDKHTVDRVFDLYFSTKPENAGVGLYMVKNFVETSMGGKIFIEGLEHGCRVTLELPKYMG